MSSRWKGYLQLVIFFIFIALLIRLFPWVLKIVQAAALGIREFWWAMLIIALGVVLIWALGKNRSKKI